MTSALKFNDLNPNHKLTKIIMSNAYKYCLASKHNACFSVCVSYMLNASMCKGTQYYYPMHLQNLKRPRSQTLLCLPTTTWIIRRC